MSGMALLSWLDRGAARCRQMASPQDGADDGQEVFIEVSLLRRHLALRTVDPHQPNTRLHDQGLERGSTMR
jgi:hypothetical protein